MEEPLKEKKKENGEEPAIKTYARYSGMAVQMAVIIFVAVWGGMKLDEISGSDKPLFTALLSLVGVIVAIYISVKDLIK